MECCGKSSLKEKSEQILCGEDYQKEEDGMGLNDIQIRVEKFVMGLHCGSSGSIRVSTA